MKKATEPEKCERAEMVLGRLPCPLGPAVPGLRLALPLPTYLRWLQNGRPAEELAGVQMASRGTTLHIDHVEPGHAGLFSCQATNEAGTAGAEVELLVHGEKAWVAREARATEPGGPKHLRLWEAYWAWKNVGLLFFQQCF